MVEQRTENPRVVGSIPTGGTITEKIFSVSADLAHLVERDLAKVEVAGSSPVIRSKKEYRELWFPILFFSRLPALNPSNSLYEFERVCAKEDFKFPCALAQMWVQSPVGDTKHLLFCF